MAANVQGIRAGRAFVELLAADSKLVRRLKTGGMRPVLGHHANDPQVQSCRRGTMQAPWTTGDAALATRGRTAYSARSQTRRR